MLDNLSDVAAEMLRDEFIRQVRYVEHLESRIAKLEAVVQFYANPKHWTIEWVEGSFGDYGGRARKVLEELERE